MRSPEDFARADMYLLLATLLRLPTQELVSLLKKDTFISSLEQVVEELALSAEESVQAQGAVRLLADAIAAPDFMLSQLRSEYTHLFDHPDRPAVQRYEGLFLYFKKHPDRTSYDGAPPRFVNPAALDAERCYKKAGFSQATELNEPADSISTELEFMYKLYQGKAEALEVADTQRIAFADECIKEFTRIHLEKWFGAFFEACARESRITFYQAIGLLGALLSAHVLKEQQGQPTRSKPDTTGAESK